MHSYPCLGLMIVWFLIWSGFHNIEPAKRGVQAKLLTPIEHTVIKTPIAGGPCCCGQSMELSFPNFDFEEPPNPPFATFFTYFSGSV
ncbi:MAG: hypothetical protein M3Q56_12985, partial [Bacteroidota bacterium]|nr:hypothetical protein [Bacteroidota bacterium]